MVFIALGVGVPLAFPEREIPGGNLGTVTLALGLVGGAYMAETIRAGIQAVPKGQMEAARSLGMSHSRAMVSIVIPQAFRIILPPLTNELILLTKDSSLVYILGLSLEEYELTKFGRDGHEHGRQPDPDRGHRAVLPADHGPAVDRRTPHGEPRGEGPLMTTDTDPETPRRRSGAAIDVRDLHKSFGDNEVLKGIDFHVEQRRGRLRHRAVRLGQVDAAALRQPAGGADAGKIFVEGDEITDPDVDIDKLRRRIGMVFQQFNLFPHLTVLRNLTIAQQRVQEARQGGGRSRSPAATSRRSAWPTRRTPTRPTSPAASSSGSRSPGRCRWTPT